MDESCDGIDDNNISEIKRFVEQKTPRKSFQDSQRKTSNILLRKRKLSESPVKVVDSDQYSSDENTLIIEENLKRKRKKKSPLTIDDVPLDLQEIIRMSGIDEMLDEKAKNIKLTATHVKNIIKQVIDNPDVNSFVKNIVEVDELNSSISYEPKYTRARTKELLDQHIKDTGYDLQNDIMLNKSTSSIQVCPEIHALATQEFPEEDDGDDYDPTFDDEGEKSEDEVRFGTPRSNAMTPASSVAATTPSTGGFSSDRRNRKTPSNLSHVALIKHSEKVVQRTLDFNRSADATQELICSRTRSKYPMNDTPVEYLEMLYKPPDVTSDMYNNAENDDVYADFLREYAMPTDTVTTGEDDVTADPDFNFMGQKQITKEDMKEEIRDDKAVHISKREYNDMMTEYLDCFQYDLYDLNDSDNSKSSELDLREPTIESEYFNSSNFHVSCETPRCDSVNSSMQRNSCETPIRSTLLKENSIIEPEYDFVIERPLSVEAPKQIMAAPIIVNFLIPRFSPHQVKALKIQMMQHIQLLTTSILLCHKIEYWSNIAIGCRMMLNEICINANESSNTVDSIYNPWNLRASIDTLAVYDNNQHLDAKIPTEEFLKKCCFTKLLKFVFLNSYAFPFVHLLPKKKYCYPQRRTLDAKLKIRDERHFVAGEDWLLTQGLREYIPNVKRYNKLMGNSRLYDGAFREIAIRIHTDKVLLKKPRAIYIRITYVRAKNRFLGRYADNPIVKFINSGIYEEQPLMPKIPQFTPCALKNVPDYANLPPFWIKYKAEYWVENHQDLPEESIAKDDEDVDNTPIYMVVYPSSTATQQPQQYLNITQSNSNKLLGTGESNIMYNIPDPGFIINPSPLIPLCSVTTAESAVIQSIVPSVMQTEPKLVDCSWIVNEACNLADIPSEGNATEGQHFTSENISKEVKSPNVLLNTPSAEDMPLLNTPTAVTMPLLMNTPNLKPSSSSNSPVAYAEVSSEQESLGLIVENLPLNDMPFLMETPAKTTNLKGTYSIETPVISCADTTLKTPMKVFQANSKSEVSEQIMAPSTPIVSPTVEKNINFDYNSPTKMVLRSSKKKDRNSYRLDKTSPNKNYPTTIDEEDVDYPDSVESHSEADIIKHEVYSDFEDNVDLDCSLPTSDISVSTELADSTIRTVRTISTSTMTLKKHFSDKNADVSFDFLNRAKETLLPNHSSTFKKLISTLRKFNPAARAPERLYLNVEEILNEFPTLANDFLLFLKPQQAMNISKYTEYCAAIRLNNFVTKLKVHSNNSQKVSNLVKLIQMMQKKVMPDTGIEGIKLKVAPMLQCPYLLDCFAKCFYQPPPLSNFDDIATEYTGTTVYTNDSSEVGLKCICQVESAKENNPSGNNHSGKKGKKIYSNTKEKKKSLL